MIDRKRLRELAEKALSGATLCADEIEFQNHVSPLTVLSLLDTIERYEKALRYLLDNSPHDGDDSACLYCDMGGAGYSSKGDGHHDDTRDVCPVVVAREALNPKEGGAKT